MNLKALTSQTSKFVTDNSPAILTALGSVGLVTTAYLTGKASFRASKLIYDENLKRGIKDGDHAKYLDKKEEAKLVWKQYIAPFAVGSLSIAAIIGANRIGTRRAAAMATALTLSERAASEYKNKVVELMGANKEQKVSNAVAQDRVERLGPLKVLNEGQGGNQLFMDPFSSRVWESTMEEVKGVINDLNYQLNNHGCATLNDLYDHLGLDHTRVGGEMGWNTAKGLIDPKFETTMSEYKGAMRSVIVLDFTVAPVRGFFRSHG